jgi:hypothetical protein
MAWASNPGAPCASAHDPCHCNSSPVWRFSAHVRAHRTPAGPELQCARVPTGTRAASMHWQQLRIRRCAGGMQLADDVDACGRCRSSGAANAVSQAFDVHNTADVSARQTARQVDRRVERNRIQQGGSSRVVAVHCREDLSVASNGQTNRLCCR